METKVTSSMSLGQIVARYPQCRELFENLGLDYCCGGKQRLSEAAEAAGKNLQEVLARINQVIENPEQTEEKDFLAMSLSDLAEHIENTHHVFMRQQLPRLSALLEKVQRAHGQRHGRMLQSLQQVYAGLRAELEMHLDKEEQILFPYIHQIEGFVEHQGEYPQMHCGTVENPIRQMEFEHDEAGAALAKFRELTDNYQLPEDACETFKALYDGLQAVELDLHQHIHLENNILFPKAVAMEKMMCHKQSL